MNKSLGVKFSNVNVNFDDSHQTGPDSLLTCYTLGKQLWIDDSLHIPKYHFYTYPRFEEKGVISTLDIAYLVSGWHDLEIKTLLVEEDSTYWDRHALIPFWKVED